MEASRDVLAQISAGATDVETASKRCEQTLHDVQRLLDPDGLTLYKFKRRKLTHASIGRPQMANPPLKSYNLDLDVFAKMVLDKTAVPYRRVTPESDKPNIKIEHNGIAPEPSHVTGNTDINGPTTPPKQPTASSSQQRRVAVVIPASLTPAQRAEYQPVLDPSPSNRQPPGAPRALSTDQRQKGDVAVQSLKVMLLDTFEAEDEQQLLSLDTLSKLEHAIAKVVTAGRLLEIEVHDLVRVQRSCETAIAEASRLDLRIKDDWCEQDEEAWLQSLRAAEGGIVAARATMRIMIGGATLKELQSEEYLHEILEAFRSTIETCIVPVVQEPSLSGEKIRGEKTQPPPNPKFLVASRSRTHVVTLMNAAAKGLRVMGDLLVRTDFDGTALSSVEALCKTLIFAENASTEKDSAVGVQNFETMRRGSMDVLAKIFTKYTEQRQYIFDEILISLEKLPATKQSARQYRLADAKPIQLVSALLMRLVQTSATKSNEALKLRSKIDSEVNIDADSASDEGSDDGMGSTDEGISKVSPTKPQSIAQDLAAIEHPLNEAARTNAWYIVKVLTTRAATTSKTSEEPYRKLLDIFTEDFINVLGSSEWPAAELLLRTLTMNMIRIADDSKSSVPSRTLALELLGTMGSGILELQAKARAATRSVDATESLIARHLCDMATQMDGAPEELLNMTAIDGPYRYAIQYLEARNTGEDAQLQTARGYHLMQWTHAALSGRDSSIDSDATDMPRAPAEVLATLKHMFSHPQWLDEQSDGSQPTTVEGRLAAIVITLQSPFCRAYERIFGTLLNSMSSEQSRVKSRSLSSIIALLEKDATMLDRNQNILRHIVRCANDPSPLVRDSALNLIDKCVSLRPKLDATVCAGVIDRTRDAATSVRKRAMKMLKEMYLRNDAKDIRVAIADAMLSRIQDTEESVIEIARANVEEMWFQPFYVTHVNGEHAVAASLAFASQAALLIEILERNDDIAPVLEALIRRASSKSKAAPANAGVCTTIIAVLFDGVIDTSDIPGSPSQDSVLRTLTVFARASPDLFTTNQLERLEPYTKNLSTTDDLDIFRSALTILRNVMPSLPALDMETLRKLQGTLLTSVTKISKLELREVAPCLWTIDNMLADSGNKDRLPNFMISVLQRLHQTRNEVFDNDSKSLGTLIKLMGIAGEFGNSCDFEASLPKFAQKCTWHTGSTVADLVVETICPYTSPRSLLSVRIAALEAVCTVSQAWPKQFLRVDVINAFEMVFRERSGPLEEVLLTGLESFFRAQEVPDGSEDGPELVSGIASGNERLGKTYVASDHDGASTALAQRFLSHLLKLALGSCDEVAFTSARLLISINKQGLVHPKESAPALVALETCPNKGVATAAFKEHQSQFQKHEGLFEKEYMRAVQRTFEYQQEVMGDAAGYSDNPPTAKLHLTWEVLKKGKAQIRKRFLANMAQKLDFDMSEPDPAWSASRHVLFTRFCLQNLAFFDFDKVDDLLHLTSGFEKIFSGTGSAIAQAIETELLELKIDAVAGAEGTQTNGTSPDNVAVAAAPPVVDDARLIQLASAAQTIYLIWETRSFLFRVWNLQKHFQKSKQLAKDSNRTASRTVNASSLTDSFAKRIEEISVPIVTAESARQMCYDFVELISVDHEVKVASDEEADVDINGYATPSESTDRKSPSVPPSGSGRGRKRKGSAASTPSRKRGRPSLGKRKSTNGKRKGESEVSDDEAVDEWP